MGLFDTIERLNIADGRPIDPKPPAQRVPTVPATAATEGKTSLQEHHQELAEEGGPDIWRPSPAEIEERRRILNRKPQRLSFLDPCPLCNGRAFLHLVGGGFICRTCHPGLFGYPVEAAGMDRPASSLDTDLLLVGDNPDTATSDPAPNAEPTQQQRAHFTAAWPWIKKHKPALLAAGWTMAALVRRARCRWPYGLWGVAWLPLWSKPDVVISMGRRGEIVFVFSSGGRIITQTAHRPPRSTTKRQRITHG